MGAVVLSQPDAETLTLGFSYPVFAGSAEGENVHCDALTGPVNATLAGQAPAQASLGGIASASELACAPIRFTFARTKLSAGDVEAKIADGTHTIRFVVGDLVADRGLEALDDLAQAKPGSSLRYQWNPATDLFLGGDGSLQQVDGSITKLGGDATANGLTIVLPAAGWPKGTLLDVTAGGKPIVRECEGVKGCEMPSLSVKEVHPLPDP